MPQSAPLSRGRHGGLSDTLRVIDLADESWDLSPSLSASESFPLPGAASFLTPVRFFLCRRSLLSHQRNGSLVSFHGQARGGGDVCLNVTSVAQHAQAHALCLVLC